MRAVEEESKKEEVVPTKLSSNKEPEVCPHRHCFKGVHSPYFELFWSCTKLLLREGNLKIVVQ